MATDEDHLLDELADAILDGTPIAWAEVDSRLGDDRRQLLDRLKVLATLADLHREPCERNAGPLRWGHLTLIETLGRGAFGEVFRARDTRLDREVALKVVSASSGSVDTRASSIIEEGRLLAQVRHPNVVTIYGAERIDDQIGLWMELVEGRTLEQLLDEGKRFTAAETLDIGVQLCAAVAAVHAAGLLHRDIKSHNVMLSDGGHVVLMDFGTGWSVTDSSRALPAGTPLYLAPELLDGGNPTIRSDIYAVGVLLFHLLTASYPVSARDLYELKHAHTRNHRVDVRRVLRDVPQRLRTAVARAIDPRPERRYQSAAEMADDLRASPSSVPRWRWAAVTILSFIVATLAVLPAFQPQAGRFSSSAVREELTTAIVPVTSTPGEKRELALSPDGTRVAFSWNRAGRSELHVTELSTGHTTQVTGAPIEGDYPTWSPDGRFLAFYNRFVDDQGNHVAAVRVTPVAEGKPRTLWQASTRLLGAGLSWSPDGKRLALSVKPTLAEPWRLMLLDVETQATNWLTIPPAVTAGDSLPAFSADGASLAFVRRTGFESALHVVDIATGDIRRLDSGKHDVRNMTWADEGRSLIFTSSRGGGRDTLWRLPLAGGEAEPVAGIGEGASFPSAAASSGRLVYLQQVLDSNLYRVELSGNTAEAPRLVAPSMRADTSPDISPDGSRLVFASNRSGSYEIWLADAEGEHANQLTHLKALARYPRWSPDGRRIAFVVRSNICVVDALTGEIRRITSGATQDRWPTWSADGRSIYFASARSGVWQLWKIAAEGGDAVQVTRDAGIKVWESSDGSSLYYSNDGWSIWRMPVGGGPPAFVLRLPDNTAYGGEWMPRPNGIYWLNQVATPRPAIEFFDFRTRRSLPAIVPSGPYDDGSGFSVSKDGRWAVFSQRDYHGADIMMIDRTR